MKSPTQPFSMKNGEFDLQRDKMLKPKYFCISHKVFLLISLTTILTSL